MYVQKLAAAAVADLTTATLVRRLCWVGVLCVGSMRQALDALDACVRLQATRPLLDSCGDEELA